MNSIRHVLPSFLITVTAVAASADDLPQPIEPEAVTLGRPVDYAQDIAPVLEANCVACHNIAIDEGDLSLEDVPAMLKGGGRGPAIVPAKPDESLLLAAASHRREPLMPPPENDVEAKPLTPRELGLIRQWILEGAGKGQAPAGTVIAWRSLPPHLKSISSVDLSPESRFIAAARGNQVELYDLPLAVSAGRLIDPGLSSLGEAGTPLYPHGAADRDLVHAVAFSPDGTMLATAGYRAVKLWRRTGLGDGRPYDLAGATAIELSNDGAALAVALGSEVRLFAVSDEKELARWTAPSRIVALAVSDDRTTVAAASEDETLHLWRAAGGEPIPARKAPAAITSLAWSGERIITGHEDGIARVWGVTGDHPEKELKSQTGAVRVVAAIPGSPDQIVTGNGGTVRIWDLAKGTEIRSTVPGDTVTDLAVSPDGKVIISTGDDGTIQFWKTADGAKLAEAKVGVAQARASASATQTHDWRKQLAAVGDSRLKSAEAALKDREEIHKKAIEMRDAAAKALEAARTADQEAAAAAKTAAEQAAAKADDAALKMQSEAAAKKAAEANGNLLKAEDALRSAERAIGLAENAVATFRDRMESRRREKQTADESVTIAEKALTAAKTAAEQTLAATSVVFTNNGDRIIVSDSGNSIQTFSPAGVPLDAMSGISASSLAATVDGSAIGLLADGTIRRIDVGGRWDYAGVLGTPQDAPLDLTRSALADRVLALAFSPDGRLLATGGGEPSRNGELMLWDVETRTLVRTFADAHSDTVQSVAISRDGRVLASAAADKFAKTFDIASGSLFRTFEGHTDHVLGVALKADNTAIATAAADLSVKVWDSETGEQQQTISGYGKQVTAIRFVGLKSEVVSASGDKTVRLHGSADGKQVRAFAGATDYVHSVAVSDDGATIVAGGDDGVLFVWDGKTGKLLHRFEPPQSADTATAAK
ncbi:MAG: c-type cytochrome domain-containing protein [Planctomycetaceae bacterium]